MSFAGPAPVLLWSQASDHRQPESAAGRVPLQEQGESGNDLLAAATVAVKVDETEAACVLQDVTLWHFWAPCAGLKHQRSRAPPGLSSPFHSTAVEPQSRYCCSLMLNGIQFPSFHTRAEVVPPAQQGMWPTKTRFLSWKLRALKSLTHQQWHWQVHLQLLGCFFFLTPLT